MTNNIEEVRLGDVLISLKTGLNPRLNFKLNTPDADNWYITVRELNGTDVNFLQQTDRVNNDGLKLINNRSNLEINDVLFSGTGTIGKTAIVTKEPTNWNIKEGVYSLKPNTDRIDPYYLLCQLGYYSRLNIFSRQTGGSTVVSIPMNVLSDTKLFLPEMDMQRKIASIIKHIDDKVSTNNKMNTNLGLLARLIYDYWFNQFDFPDENGKPYRSSGGRMITSGKLKQEVPYGWSIQNICEIAELQGGGTPSKSISKYWNGRIPFFTPTDAENEMFCLRTRDTITELGVKSSSTKLFDTGSIFVTARGSVGKVVIAGSPMSMNQSCYAFLPKRELGSEFIYFTIMDMVRYLKAKSSGSVFSSIVTSDILYTPVVIPPDYLMKKYSQEVTHLFESIRENIQENIQLAELKDWLLPMLMTGQIRVT